MSAKQGPSKEANGFNSRTLRHAEGTAEWPATGPENRGFVMSDGRSIRLPSAKSAQVREPGRNGPAVTRFPRVGRGGSNPPLCTMCQRVRIGIAACLRNRCLRVRISPLAPAVLLKQGVATLLRYSRIETTRELIAIGAFLAIRPRSLHRCHRHTAQWMQACAPKGKHHLCTWVENRK